MHGIKNTWIELAKQKTYQAANSPCKLKIMNVLFIFSQIYYSIINTNIREGGGQGILENREVGDGGGLGVRGEYMGF